MSKITNDGITRSASGSGTGCLPIWQQWASKSNGECNCSRPLTSETANIAYVFNIIHFHNPFTSIYCPFLPLPLSIILSNEFCELFQLLTDQLYCCIQDPRLDMSRVVLQWCVFLTTFLFSATNILRKVLFEIDEAP